MAASTEASYKSGAQKRKRNEGSRKMPHLLLETPSALRSGADDDYDVFDRFYRPISIGDKLTPEIVSLTPKTYYFESKISNEVPDTLFRNNIWVVSSRVKKIIEDLEPQIHTFLPVNLRDRKRDRDCGQYFFVYIGQAIDAVVIDETNFRDGFGRSGFEHSWVINTLVPNITLNTDQITRRHLWRGGRGKVGGGGDPFFYYTFCSDDFKAHMKAANVKGFRFIACENEFV